MTAFVLAATGACGRAPRGPAASPSPVEVAVSKPEKTAAPQAAASPSPFPVVDARGPWPTVAALCAGLGEEEDDSGSSLECRRGEDEAWDVPVDGPLQLREPPAPFRSVRVIAAEGLDVHCYLLFELDQLYLGPPIACGSQRARSDIELRVTAFEARQLVPGGSGELVLRMHVRSTYDERDQSEHPSDTPVQVTDWDQLMLCGMHGDRPACTTPLVVEVAETTKTGDGKVASHEVTRAVVRLGSGRLSIERPVKVASWPEGWPPNGTYVLPFAE